jgi:hypothetical protein
MEGGMSGRERIRCAACKKRIAASEPDFELRRLADGRRRYYHTRCMTATFETVARAPDVWLMTVRHVKEKAD